MPELGEVEDPAVITALPLYHIFALTTNMLVFTHVGGNNVLITNPRDMPGFVRSLRRCASPSSRGVNTLFNALLHTPGFDKLDFRSLQGRARRRHGGAGARSPSDGARSPAGTSARAGGSPSRRRSARANLPRDTEFSGSIGCPIPSTEISIRDDDGNALPNGSVGEICIRGPQVMRGYWNRPEETAKVMTAGRRGCAPATSAAWTRAGCAFIEDRKKDMILVSGFNVYPNEVEGMVAEMPGVLEVAAVAQADEKSGEVVALFIVKKDPALTADDVIAYCKHELTPTRCPSSSISAANCRRRTSGRS